MMMNRSKKKVMSLCLRYGTTKKIESGSGEKVLFSHPKSSYLIHSVRWMRYKKAFGVCKVSLRTSFTEISNNSGNNWMRNWKSIDHSCNSKMKRRRKVKLTSLKQKKS